jgi:pyruvate dehydrogenase E1 component beta subunit
MLGGQVSVPIVFRGPNASAGQLGATHSVAYESMYAHFPGIKVINPSEPGDAKGLLKSAIRDNDTVLFMESEQMYGLKGDVNEDPEHLIPIGKAAVKREGSDVTLVTHGKIYHTVVKAATELAKDGIEAEIVDLRSVKPLDMDTVIDSVKKTHRCVVVDEAHPFAGTAAEVGYLLQRDAFDELDAPVVRVTLPDVSAPFSKSLFDAWFPSVKDVVDGAKQVLYKS